MKEAIPPEDINPAVSSEESNGVETLKKSRKLKNVARIAALASLAFADSDIKPLGKVESVDEMKERAKVELSSHGITREQKEGYILGINDLIYHEITPGGYATSWHEIKETLLRERQTLSPQKEDAWKLYLGLPQSSDTFGISDFRPSKSSENKYYYKINGMRPSLTPKDIPAILQDVDFYSDKKVKRRTPMFDYKFGIMGEYAWSKGEDEKGHYVAYYDKWDLGDPLEKHGIFGKPFEIYDRIYYDPETYDIVE